MNITHITARTILDSRGNPTVEAEVWCAGGWGRAAVPSGASTGQHEAHELRDGATAWHGRGVEQAVQNIEGEIKRALIDQPADSQAAIDQALITLDGSENKSRLGANALLAVSLATAHAAAAARGVALWQHINDLAGNPKTSIPTPLCNVLNGGSHAANASDFQEYMLVPKQVTGYQPAIQMLSEIFHSLKATLKERGLHTTVGDEGGFAPAVASNTETLDLLQAACVAAGYQPGEDVVFALDVAASEFYQDASYHLAAENRSVNEAEMVDYLKTIAQRYPIISIEDGLAEDAWTGWQQLTAALPNTQIVGDDLLVTNQQRLERAITEQAANAILIKPNQIGTLSETLTAISTAQAAGWQTIISHRSGETEDVSIAHLAVGTGAGQIKTGSVSRGERTAKHNELLRIAAAAPEIPFAAL